MAYIIDTHCHLYTEEFDQDRTAAVLRAQEAGVGLLLLPNIDAPSLLRIEQMCAAWPQLCRPMMGLHPEEVHEDYSTLLDAMEQQLASNQTIATEPSQRYIAIGEVGLDLYWDATYRQQQIQALDRQLSWAAHYSLPLVIHCRAAHADLMALMEKHRQEHLRGIFHCFGGTVDEATELLSHEGFVLGIGGAVTYKKSTLPTVLRQSVPLHRIVVETDAPWLAPVPHRGKRNESAYIVHTVQKLSEVYGCPYEEIANITTANACHLFGLKVE